MVPWGTWGRPEIWAVWRCASELPSSPTRAVPPPYVALPPKNRSLLSQLLPPHRPPPPPLPSRAAASALPSHQLSGWSNLPGVRSHESLPSPPTPSMLKGKRPPLKFRQGALCQQWSLLLWRGPPPPLLLWRGPPPALLHLRGRWKGPRSSHPCYPPGSRPPPRRTPGVPLPGPRR